jgi:hypothetical protein
MSVHQAFSRSVNRVFILGTIEHIQPNTSGQSSEYHIIVQTQYGWTDNFGNQKTQIEQHYIVLDHNFAEDCQKLNIGQSVMLQGRLKVKQNGQYPQFKCASYIQAVQLFDLNALLELDDIEDNDGLPFPKQLVNSLWSK